jgi:hypothetical protein
MPDAQDTSSTSIPYNDNWFKEIFQFQKVWLGIGVVVSAKGN